MAQGLSTPDPSFSPTHLSIRRGRATTIHYRHHQVSLMVSRNTTLVLSLGLRIGPACEAGLTASIRRECVPPQNRKKERHRWSMHRKRMKQSTLGARRSKFKVTRRQSYTWRLAEASFWTPLGHTSITVTVTSSVVPLLCTFQK